MPTITPFLWFENQAEEAMQHYLSIFRNSKTISVDAMLTMKKLVIADLLKAHAGV